MPEKEKVSCLPIAAIICMRPRELRLAQRYCFCNYSILAFNYRQRNTGADKCAAQERLLGKRSVLVALCATG